MTKDVKSRYGVYRDLSLSPYEFENPYGDIFKFRSQKKLDIYTREIPKEIDRVSKTVGRLSLDKYVSKEIILMLYRYTYQALYDRIEG